MRFLYLILAGLALASCNELARKVADEAVKSNIVQDSITEEQNEKPVALDHYLVLQRLKKGDDSVYLVREFFLTGEKYSESWFKNELRDSVCRFYYKSGKLSHTWLYKNGVIEETRESFTPEGNPRSEDNVRKGSGRLKLYHPITHHLIADVSLKNGFKNGAFKSWYSNGMRHESCMFKEDTAIGPFTVWHRSGAVKVLRTDLPGATSYTYHTFYANGKPESSEIREKTSGTLSRLVKYDEAGNIAEKGTAVGQKMKSTKYFYNARHALTSRGAYLDGKKNGSFEYFYDNGKKRSLETYNDDMISAETKWYENGKVQMTTNYKDGSYDGWYVEYYSNGVKRIEQQYENGVKHGQYKSYFKNGNKYYEANFDKGKPVGEMKVYTSDGKLQKTTKHE